MRRLALLAAFLFALAAPAATACPRASLPDIEDEVMCPVCGTPLNVSQAPQAEREREFIRGLIAQCKSKDEIKDALVAQFGPAVLAMPKGEGFELAAYLVPAAVVLAALVLLAFMLPRWRRRSRGSPRAGPELAAADARRLDDDLARFDL